MTGQKGYREDFPMKIFLLKGKVCWQVHCHLHLLSFTEFADLVQGWQRLGSEVTVFGKWPLSHMAIFW